MSDLKEQAVRLLTDMANGHDKTRHLDADCPLCQARIEAFGRAVQAEQRAWDATKAWAGCHCGHGVRCNHDGCRRARQIAEAIERED